MENSISVQKESSKTVILISKIITGITIIYLFSFIIVPFSDIQKPLSPYTFSFLIYVLIRVGVFFFQIFLIVKLIYPFKSKYNFTNLERKFHPFFIHDGKFNYFIIIFLLPGIQVLGDYFKNKTPESSGFDIWLHGVIVAILMTRVELLNKFPTKFIKSNNVRLIVKYEDYINHKIADDEPHIKINQHFEVNLKSLPRNDYEKNLIEIKNPNTPIYPALVYKIEDVYLANAIREGYILKAKLIKIKEEGNLEIELSLKEKKQDLNN